MDRFLHEYYELFHALPTIIHMDGGPVNKGQRMAAVLRKRGALTS